MNEEKLVTISTRMDKEGAIELYLKRELSIEGAAKFADIYIGEFLELLKSKGIELNLSLEYYKEGLKNLKSIWK